MHVELVTNAHTLSAERWFARLMGLCFSECDGEMNRTEQYEHARFLVYVEQITTVMKFTCT